MNATERLAQHAIGTRFDALSGDAVAQAKIFILDTLGVGIAGSTALGARQLIEAASLWGEGNTASLWGRASRVPVTTAAMVNAFQIHCQEYDCVHEGAVLHPMAAVLPAALAFAERTGGVSGRDLLMAVAVGVDVAVSLGVASRVGLSFFRPATAGGFGAVAAVARLAGFSVDQLIGAFGLQLAQVSGTMQAHIEGSIALPMQVGFNARAALQSLDLASLGVSGARDVFESPFGYMKLIEGAWDFAPVLETLGKRWRIAEVSHKPYPAGRATHGGVEAIMQLRAAHPFATEEVENICVTGPPVISGLCGRPDVPAPSPTYARLCMAYIGAKVLQHGCIDLAHYRGDELTDPRTHALAPLITMRTDGSTNPNALVPQEVVIRLRDGRTHVWRGETMLASPERRLTREQHLTKFRRCWEFAAEPLPVAQADALIAMVDALEEVADVRTLVRLLVP